MSVPSRRPIASLMSTPLPIGSRSSLRLCAGRSTRDASRYVRLGRALRVRESDINHVIGHGLGDKDNVILLARRDDPVLSVPETEVRG